MGEGRMHPLLLLVLLSCALIFVTAAAPAAPSSLLCGYLRMPTGIDVPAPRLSWTITHSERGQRSTAYTVQASKDASFSNILWTTPKVKSGNNFINWNKENGATALESDTRYYWRVMWWDANDVASAWSSSYFDTGLLMDNLWVGQWIGGTGNVLRKVFSLPSAPSRARAFVSGIGYYELFINGQRVGDSQLDPGWTTYNKRVLYNVYDVTSLLKSGDNAVGVMLGHGWYSSGYDREPNGPRSLIFQLSVDGKVTAQSDASWYITQGPITADDVYNGETYDARREQPGWNTASFSMPGSWVAAQKLNGPGGKLSFQMIPNIKITNEIKPLSITNPTNGTYVFDFGQNFSGKCRLTISGPAGTTVTMHHAEVLEHSGDGLIYIDNLRGAKATDVYILKGSGTEVYEPHFTTHGFRYVQYTVSANIVPTLNTLLGLHQHTDVMKTGDIQIGASSNILNRIQQNIIWGQRSNLMSVPTDCDQRDERKGWMGDAQLSAEEAFHNFDMPAFYVHFLNLIRDEQGTDGTLTDTVPWTFGSRPADPAWGSAYPSLAYWLWKYYNDEAVVIDHYPNLKLYIDYLGKRVAESGIGEMFFNYGDWVPPPPAKACSAHLTSAFSYIANLQQFIEMATAIGKTDDAAHYKQIMGSAANDFNSAFLKAGNTYDSGVQTALVLPLWLGIVPSAQKNAVINNLLNNISDMKTHLTTGIIGTKYLMETLHWIGRDDVALQIAENLDYPSWGFMVVNPVEPATAVWELWDGPGEGPGMNSRSHIMFGSVSDWFYKALAGITYGSSGFDMINIAPSIVGDLTSVSSYFQTGQGVVKSAYMLTNSDSVCATAAEGQDIEIDCAKTGMASAVITDIKFASFGLPLGQCGYFSHNETCSAVGIEKKVHQSCVGKSSCILKATHIALGVEKDCDHFSRMYVEAVCGRPKSASTIAVKAAATLGYTLSVSIPVGATAKIAFPRLDLTNETITEGGKEIWKDKKYQPGQTGITNVALGPTPTTVVATVGSGDYQFTFAGAKGDTICGASTESFTVNLACPHPNQVITLFRFASFGEAYGVCGNYHVGSCHAGSTLTVVNNECVGKNKCSLKVDPSIFGDPCFQTPKSLVVEAVCSY